MTVINPDTGTTLDEIAAGIFRISTPIPPNPALKAGFSFNQFLIDADEPLLFHTKVLEPFTVASVVALGGVIALAAAFFPVRTVLKTDVMAVLREQ